MGSVDEKEGVRKGRRIKNGRGVRILPGREFC